MLGKTQPILLASNGGAIPGRVLYGWMLQIGNTQIVKGKRKNKWHNIIGPCAASCAQEYFLEIGDYDTIDTFWQPHLLEEEKIST
jgi:hypothetical protein